MTEAWPITVPRENANDDVVILVRWLVQDGEYVAEKSPIAEIETSKAVVDLVAEKSGYIRRGAKEMDQVPIGSTIGVISVTPEQDTTSGSDAVANLPQSGKPTGDSVGQTRFSRRAQELIAEHELDPMLFSALTMVRESDVQSALEARETISDDHAAPLSALIANGIDGYEAVISEVVPLSPRKRTEIRYLSEGNREALASAITILVKTEPLDTAIEAAADERTLTYLDYVVAAAARVLRKYPEFNAFLTPEGIAHYSEVNVGVSMNMSQGLVVPVIRNANRKSPEQVSREVSQLAVKYLRNNLAEADLVGGTFTVTDLSSAGAFHVLPLINRRQSAILAIGSEADFFPGCLVLTLAFDHRIGDGLRATEYLRELKETLEVDLTDARVIHGTAASSPTRSITCDKCLNTSAREELGEYFVSVVKRDGTQVHLCTFCLAGWND